jgi:hypothetical protein
LNYSKKHIKQNPNVSHEIFTNSSPVQCLTVHAVCTAGKTGYNLYSFTGRGCGQIHSEYIMSCKGRTFTMPVMSKLTYCILCISSFQDSPTSIGCMYVCMYLFHMLSESQNQSQIAELPLSLSNQNWSGQEGNHIKYFNF